MKKGKLIPKIKSYNQAYDQANVYNISTYQYIFTSYNIGKLYLFHNAKGTICKTKSPPLITNHILCFFYILSFS